MSNIDKYLQDRKQNNGRTTPSKKAILEILNTGHLTIDEIEVEMHRRDFHNLQTIYNNINSFIEAGVISETYINGKRYFENVLNNENHTANFSTHLYSTYDHKIREISDKYIYELIKNYKEINDYPVLGIKIIVTVGKKKSLQEADSLDLNEDEELTEEETSEEELIEEEEEEA